jgi:hypothetical protein
MDPARTFKESLTSRPELENSQGHWRSPIETGTMSETSVEADVVTRTLRLPIYRSQRIVQCVFPCKLGGRLGLVSIASHLDAKLLALATYLPTPALGVFSAPP